jgi:hypothetical protein
VGKRPLGRLRRRREDFIRMDRREIGCRRVEWIQLAQDVKSSCEYGDEHLSSGTMELVT